MKTFKFFIFVVFLFCSCRSEQKLDSSNVWYNSSFFKPVFGDFEKTLRLKYPNDLRKYINRGRYLVNGPAHCGQCHMSLNTDDLSGGKKFKDSFGWLYVPNITSDDLTGIGAWNYSEIVRAIRDSIDRSGKPLSIAAHSQYKRASDFDLKSMAIYLKSTNAVKNEVVRRNLGGLERNSWLLFSKHSLSKGYTASLSQGESKEHGFILATTIASCSSCHTKESQRVEYPDLLNGWEEREDRIVSYLKGLSDFDSKERSIENGDEVQIISNNRDVAFSPIPAKNIRGGKGGGLSKWSYEEIVNFLSSGMTNTGKKVSSDLCPWNYYARMTDDDKMSIAKFVKSLH